MLQALAEKKIGRRDQANNWIWRCANMTREVHEEYAVQRWPETKRLLGLLVNSSGGAHARNARRLVHASRQQDRRLSAALLAAAIPHTAEAGEVVNGARTRMSRKPAALARELLRNFPKGGKGRRGTRRRKKKGAAEGVAPEAVTLEANGLMLEDGAVEEVVGGARRASGTPPAARSTPTPMPIATRAPKPRGAPPAAQARGGRGPAVAAARRGRGGRGGRDRGGARRTTRPRATVEAARRAGAVAKPEASRLRVVAAAGEAPLTRAARPSRLRRRARRG